MVIITNHNNRDLLFDFMLLNRKLHIVCTVSLACFEELHIFNVDYRTFAVLKNFFFLNRRLGDQYSNIYFLYSLLLIPNPR